MTGTLFVRRLGPRRRGETLSGLSTGSVETAEFVEVKTTTSGIDSRYVDEKTTDVNDKFARAGEDVTTDGSVLEIRTRESTKSPEQIGQEVQSAIDTRQSIPADIEIAEIRILRNGEPLEPVTVTD